MEDASNRHDSISKSRTLSVFADGLNNSPVVERISAGHSVHDFNIGESEDQAHSEDVVPSEDKGAAVRPEAVVAGFLDQDARVDEAKASLVDHPGEPDKGEDEQPDGH